MFNLSGSELVFLVLIALVVLGPDKLPEAIRKAGKAYNEFKKMTSSFQDEMRTVLDEPLRELRETTDLMKSSAMFDPSPQPNVGTDFAPPGNLALPASLIASTSQVNPQPPEAAVVPEVAAVVEVAEPRKPHVSYALTEDERASFLSPPAAELPAAPPPALAESLALEDTTLQAAVDEQPNLTTKDAPRP